MMVVKKKVKVDSDYVLIRTYSAGVHVGLLKRRYGKEVELVDSRRVWYWVGAFTLNQLSQTGPKLGSKISVSVPSIVLTEAIEIIPCSVEAKKAFMEIEAHSA